MKHWLLMTVVCVSCHSNASFTSSPAATLPAKDTTPLFCLKERLYLFSHILLQSNQFNIGINDNTGKLFIAFRFPTRYMRDTGMENLQNHVNGYNSLVMDFVMGDSIYFFNGIEYILEDPDPDKRALFRHQFALNDDTVATPLDQKLRFFSSAAMVKMTHNYLPERHAISFNLAVNVPVPYASDSIFRSLTTCYAQLLYAYRVFSIGQPYNHLEFTLTNANQEGVNTYQYSYYTTDPPIRNIKSIFPPFVYLPLPPPVPEKI